MARFDEIYEKYKKKQQNGTGNPGAVTSASGTGTVAAEKNANSGGYKATGRFAGILANYQKNGASFSGVDDSYVQSFFKDAQAYTKKASEESRNIDWALATDKAKTEERNQALTDLANRAKAVKVYLTSNKKNIDPKAYEEYMRFLKDFETDKQNIYDTFLGNTNYYSQFGSQDEVNLFEAGNTETGLQDMKASLEKELEDEQKRWEAIEADPNSYGTFEYSEMEEEHWNKEKALKEKLSKVEQKLKEKDFDATHSTKEGRQAWYADLQQQKQTLEAQRQELNQKLSKAGNALEARNHKKQLEEVTAQLKSIEAEMRKYERGGTNESGQEYGTKVLDDAQDIMAKPDFAEMSHDPDYDSMTEGELFLMQMEEVWNGWGDMTEEETKVFNYLWNTKGKEAANEYRDELQRQKNRVASQEQTQKMQEKYQSADVGGKVLMNILSVPANVAGGALSAVSDVGKILQGQEIDPNNAMHQLMSYGTTVRQEAASDLDETGIKLPVLDFTLGDAYQAGMSMADSLLSAAFGGTVGGVLLATGAASNEAARLYEQGASNDQVAMGALLAGAAEMVFEKYSIEKLITMKNPASKREVIKNALIQGGIEASEESLTEIANTLTNAMVMGSQSDWKKLLEKHDGDAVQALLEKSKDVINAGLGGFLSGAPAGALASLGKQNQQQTAQEKTNATVQAKSEAEAPAVGIDGVAWPTREDIERMEAGETVQPKSKQPAAQTTTQPQQADKRLEWAKQDKEGLEAMIQKRQKADSIVVQRMNTEIDQLQAEYDGLKNKGTDKAKQLLGEIEEKRVGVERYKATGEEAVQKLQARLDKANQEIEMLEWEPEAGEVEEAQQTTQRSEETPAQQTQDQEAEIDEDIVGGRLAAKRKGLQWRLEQTQKLKEQYVQEKNEQIRIAQSLLDRKKDKTTKVAQKLKNRIVTLEAQRDAQMEEYDRKMDGIQKQIAKVEAQQKEDHTKENLVEKAIRQIEEERKAAELEATAKYYRERSALLRETEDRSEWIRKKAADMKWEMANWVKGESKASPLLKILFKEKLEWKDLYNALTDVKDDPLNFSKYPTDAEVAVRDLLDRAYEETKEELKALEDRHDQRMKEIAKEAEEKKRKEERITRAELHAKIMEHVRAVFESHGYDFDEVMRKAKNLSTLQTVDNTPQRVLEKALGYKEGGILADLTVNKIAQDESEAIRWLNSFTDRKNGLLAKISREYGIKPGSKESQAAQMYAEGFFVNDKNEIVEYTDRELAMDFPDTKVQENIKKMARDPRIRQIYDETLDAINEARVRNGYPAIPRLANYFLHFRAQADTFSQLGLPFNPNDIRAKDLPTDLNGVTADLKPGQPYFASSMHRKGKRTSFDLLGGLEMYLNSAKNQIFHIDNIQTLRALRNDLADTFGQANGLENLDELSDAEAEERIKEVFGGHLSTFAKFLNEEANVLAGKTSLIDRGIEGVFGRRAITFLNDLNKQVGSNAVGYSVSSGIVNLDAIPRAVAKGSKRDFAKAVGQMATNLLTNRDDGFAENSPVIIRRKGAERFNRTLWQKLSDPGYALAGAVDGVATELIARMKYNELTRKGMDPQKAHFETDKWVSKLMGDRSLGQQPQIFNSKMLGLITKYQLEVRNNLDSMFYDTIQEEKASKEYIEDRLERNKKTAAAITYRLVSLAVLQHAFGMGFEALTGNNPSFDLIDVLVKALGIDDWDDDEEEKDTFGENLEEGFLALLEDLPYTSTLLNGGRIPISNALPIEEVITGKDKYGNEKSRWKTVLEALPYYLSPGGYGQAKKIWQGTEMYLHENPGSYTRDENGELQLRYPVEEGIAPWLQAALFGRWSGQEAQQYLDEGRKPLTEKQTKEFFESGMTIQQYWDYRDELGKLKKQDEKLALINGMDLSDEQKRVLKSYLFDEEGYAEDNPEKYAFLEEEGVGYLGWKELPKDAQEAWNWAFNHQDEYRHYKKNGVLPGDYTTYQVPMLEFKDEANQAYEWEYNYPDKAVMGDVFADGVTEYRKYTKAMSELKADKDQRGETVAGSRKNKVTDYINGLDLDYGEKIILYKMEYPGEHEYDWDIVEYLNSRRDLSEEQIVKILEQLGAKVKEDGSVKWK